MNRDSKNCSRNRINASGVECSEIAMKLIVKCSLHEVNLLAHAKA